MKRLLTCILCGLVIFAATVYAGPRDPIVGEDFEKLVAAQNVALQNGLRTLFPESLGYVVAGPLAPSPTHQDTIESVDDWLCGWNDVRVICLADTLVHQVLRIIIEAPHLSRGAAISVDSTRDNWRVAMGRYHDGTVSDEFVVTPMSRLLHSIWRMSSKSPDTSAAFRKAISEYASNVLTYLSQFHSGHTEATPPVAGEYGLPESVDLFAPPPDYVIEGYQNYKDFLNRHATINTEFAHGVLSFVPSDSLIDVLKDMAPKAAFPNKEYPMFQHEMRKFFERGGDMQVLQTLTREGFDTLRAGEYFFAVGVNGTIRFGRELLREEVQRIETETGHKVPRANHAFLFPGEPVLTAGAFFIERDSLPRLTEVNAQSGHYFYSNVSPTIREDIVERSDYYLLTLGHFFTALDSLGIASERVLVSKL